MIKENFSVFYYPRKSQIKKRKISQRLYFSFVFLFFFAHFYYQIDKDLVVQFNLLYILLYIKNKKMKRNSLHDKENK